MWRLKDRHGHDYCLGPTHEEMITTLAHMDVNSYRQLPLSLYQIQDKFRDERRPRFGLMRSREFIMKDAYTFDKDEEGLNKSYQDMYDAYSKIFTRCGLMFRPVEADSGAIGGSGSHEFMVLADSGEAEISYCTQCDYAADTEKAELNLIEASAEAELPKEKVATPDCKTIADVCAYLKSPVENGAITKSMISKSSTPAASTNWKWLPPNCWKRQELQAVTWAPAELIRKRPLLYAISP